MAALRRRDTRRAGVTVTVGELTELPSMRVEAIGQCAPLLPEPVGMGFRFHFVGIEPVRFRLCDCGGRITR